mgnify:CR=1 FL=1
MSVVDRSFKLPGNDVGVLFIHGLVGNPIEMRYAAGVVARDGYTVHGCQLAGHGGSEADLRATGWKDWLQSTLNALDEMRKVCKTIIVVGNCAGAILAIRTVLERQPQIAGLVLYSPVLWYDGPSIPRYAHIFLKPLMNTPLRHLYTLPDREPFGIKDERIRRMKAEAFAADNNAEFGGNGTPASALQQMNQLIGFVKPRLSEVKIRTLIIHSREDDAASMRNPAYLQRHLGGIVETVVLDDSYHIISIDKQRQLVAEKTRQFVAAIADRARELAPIRIAAE